MSNFNEMQLVRTELMPILERELVPTLEELKKGLGEARKTMNDLAYKLKDLGYNIRNSYLTTLR